MSDFSDSPKWRLINNFTIYEDRSLSRRPYMLTCVPKSLDVTVTQFEVIRYIEWPSTYGDGPKEAAYKDRSFIKFSGNLHDRIVVFNMPEGEIATFRTLTDATIRPLPAGTVGGKNNATVYDGIIFSGMSSQEVPQNGLMEGEPGALSYFAEDNETGRVRTPASINATLFLDEDKFPKVLASLSNLQKPVRNFKLCIVAELFESEMSASLSESWMSRDYGLLMKAEKRTEYVSTNARLESLLISTGAEILLDDDTK